MLRTLSVRLVRAVVLSFTVVWALASDANAQSDREPAADRSNFAFGIVAGTLGIGGELGVRVHPNVIVRANAIALPSSYAFDTNRGTSDTFGISGSNTITYTPSLTSAGLIVDVHMFRDGGRLSAGLRYIDLTIDTKYALGKSGNLIRVGDTSYTVAQAGDPKGTITMNATIAPYLGLGYDTTFFKDYGFAVSLDFGLVLATAPKVSFTAGAGVSAADIKKERDTLENRFQFLQYYPVAMMAAKYRF